MKVTEKKEIIERVTKVYVADDGKEFSTQTECIEYEKELKRAVVLNELNKYRIKEMDDCLPIDTDGYPCDSSEYKWYKINNKEEFELLKEIYGEWLTEPEFYPEVICVEDIYGDYYHYYMSNMLETTKEFWGKLGYDVMFEKNERWFNL